MPAIPVLLFVSGTTHHKLERENMNEAEGK
jgi:hypothetical protein